MDTTPVQVRQRRKVVVFLLSMSVALAAPGHAGFLEFTFTDNPRDFRARFIWSLPMGKEPDIAGPFVGTHENWTVKQLNGFANQDAKGNLTGSFSLQVIPQHTPGAQAPEGDPEHGPNSEAGFFQFSGIKQHKEISNTYAMADRVIHGFKDATKPPHADYFIGIVKTRIGGQNKVDVTVFGKHVGEQDPFKASFENFSDTPINVKFIPSYGKDDFENEPINGGTVQPGKSTSKKLPDKGKKKPTDYRVQASASALTDTTVAYLGLSDEFTGVDELEVSPMTEMLIGNEAYLLPMLREHDLSTDIYVFIDPLQWIASEAAFSPLQPYDVVDGRNDLLPGVFVSTTPITINNDGSLQGTPFSGSVFAAGGIDGQAVAIPEPGIILLFVSGIAAVMKLQRKRSRPSLATGQDSHNTPGLLES